ncbi:hypothetical protein EG329_012751 [Mollisiaceae sp. DMI_Dod_QoI]|nr:hypothetical protein EG329_012751 [Helotiales sp. DMI_Dod_QoI]
MANDVCKADEHPNAEVIGTDLSPIQTSVVPVNLFFEVDDVDEVSPDLRQARFGMIHCCLGNAFSKRRWRNYLDNAYAQLAPGGWLEIKDFDLIPASQDGSLPQDSAIVRWHSSSLKAHAEQAGFINVTIKEFVVPFGIWCRDPKMKQVGAIQSDGFSPWARRSLVRHIYQNIGMVARGCQGFDSGGSDCGRKLLCFPDCRIRTSAGECRLALFCPRDYTDTDRARESIVSLVLAFFCGIWAEAGTPICKKAKIWNYSEVRPKHGVFS